MMNGAKKSDSLIIPAKPANKAGPPRCGAGEGKQRDREKCGIAKHGPNAEPGSRVTGAGPHTWSGHQEQEGEAHSAPAPHHDRRPAEIFLQTEESRSSKVRGPCTEGLGNTP